MPHTAACPRPWPPSTRHPRCLRSIQSKARLRHRPAAIPLTPATPADGAKPAASGEPGATGEEEADKDPYEGIAEEELPPDLQYSADSSVSFPTNI